MKSPRSFRIQAELLYRSCTEGDRWPLESHEEHPKAGDIPLPPSMVARWIPPHELIMAPLVLGTAYSVEVSALKVKEKLLGSQLGTMKELKGERWLPSCNSTRL